VVAQTRPARVRDGIAPAQTAPPTNSEASDRLGCGRSTLLLQVGDPPERQSVAEFSVGDEPEVLEGWFAGVDLLMWPA
jgi:hypothetical protein